MIQTSIIVLKSKNPAVKLMDITSKVDKMVAKSKIKDGQVLVFQDVLGLNLDFKPKFVKSYLDGASCIQQSINTFVDDIQSGVFPNHEHCYER